VALQGLPPQRYFGLDAEVELLEVNLTMFPAILRRRPGPISLMQERLAGKLTYGRIVLGIVLAAWV
jgi:hypothetical protein